jgi:hypothetical protein
VLIAGTWLGNDRQSSGTPPQMNDQREFSNGEIAPAKPVLSAKTCTIMVKKGKLAIFLLVYLLKL